MPRPWEPGRSEGEYGPRPIAQPGYRADTTIERLATTLQFVNLLLPTGLFNQLDVRGRRPVARQIDAESALGRGSRPLTWHPGAGRSWPRPSRCKAGAMRGVASFRTAGRLRLASCQPYSQPRVRHRASLPLRRELPPVRPSVCADDPARGADYSGSERSDQNRVAPSIRRQHRLVVTQLAGQCRRRKPRSQSLILSLHSTRFKTSAQS